MPAQDELKLPLKEGSVRFAVLGDTGTGDKPQYEVAKQVITERQRFPFEFVLLLGDNMYGGESESDFVRKFEEPYRPLLDAKIPFYAALGNHDDPNERFYKPFNMNGERYYSFKKGSVRFFALDSNYMDKKQLEWLETQLRSSNDTWKICYFHHPLYSSGMHGSEEDLRAQLEPLFLKYGVNAVFAGHEHFYERVKPQKGIYYFTNGGGAKLRKGDIGKTNMTAVGFDTDRSFMLVEIADDALYFHTFSRTGKTVDSGVLQRQEKPKPPPATPTSSW